MERQVSDHIRRVQSYYDANTARFLKWGRDEGTANLHAALWAEGVGSLAAAMQQANELIAREIEACPIPIERVLDLGCGVGAGIFYLGRRLPGLKSLTGVTLSPVQAALANKGIPAGSPAGKYRFEAESFLALSAGRFTADFAFAIESFTHGPEPELFFEMATRLLPLGGRLAIIDDCLAEWLSEEGLSAADRQLLDRYRRSWLLPGLLRAQDLNLLAGRQGFALIKNEDLTAGLRLGRPRDRAIALVVRLFGRWMGRGDYRRALLGGDAKQKCYLKGLCRYRLLVFEKSQTFYAP